ncbi:mannitol-1-/sugar-/sorbitol-6-phosphatase [Entomortierella parvispora]|uniref:Mannitol-1-/sugar-/sorbitol-6-phosphatase n=1 Tax=Entomortierella parvispora TaxID=205924 RepID=A0A9P3H3Z1_9FUNG|nr:mannitol-1-/sugar-/sorbitol-6-phosphatase [Entomortierella parvispora]
MPPQPPEETSVLSHRSSNQDPESGLILHPHPKDPLAYTTSSSVTQGLAGLGLGGLKSAPVPTSLRHGATLSIDYSMMAHQPFQQHHQPLHPARQQNTPQQQQQQQQPQSLPPPQQEPQHQQQQQQQMLMNGNGLSNGYHHHHHHHHHPYSPYGTPSPVFSNYSPIETFHSAHGSPMIPIVSEYKSPPASPSIDLAHFRTVASIASSSAAAAAAVVATTTSNTSVLKNCPEAMFSNNRSLSASSSTTTSSSTSPTLKAPPPYSPPDTANGFYGVGRRGSVVGGIARAAGGAFGCGVGGTSEGVGLISSYVSMWKKISWVIFTMGIFLMPYAVLKACFHVQVSAGAWQTSLTYGMLMAVDFLAVITFSALNRRRVKLRVEKRDPHWVGLSTGILAVGYREDPVLLEGCLKSLKAIRYVRNQRVLLVVDGNEKQDEYMAQIFMKVFEKQGAAVFRPDFLCMDRSPSDRDREELVRQIAYHPGPVCVMQPHRGKRSAMYTGFAALQQQGIESVVVTDSDTYLDPAVCKELAFALAESPIVGAATGDVRIYNTGTWVSFLSSLRYWFAFNLERGAQSYHSVVNCVSGPLGIYRMTIVADVMDAWVKQSFLGVLCTYGDDRHLTNLVLREGYKVKYSHYAICYTDTPIRFIAWVTQQTRWSKSFFREIPIQLGCMHLHSPWMTYALLYQLIYPMMMVYNLVNCIYYGTGSQICWWLVSISFVGLMKTAYAVKVTGEKKFFFTTIYGFLYMLGYVPAKIYAALTLYDNSWGTR